jgi:hypothetical protein
VEDIVAEKKTGGKGQGLPRGKSTYRAGLTMIEDGDADDIIVERNPNDKNSKYEYRPPVVGGKRGSPFKNLDEASEYASELQRETRGMKKGGMVKSASSRADGCAIRGKTKGKFV